MISQGDIKEDEIDSAFYALVYIQVQLSASAHGQIPYCEVNLGSYTQKQLKLEDSRFMK